MLQIFIILDIIYNVTMGVLEPRSNTPMILGDSDIRV
jgi:hypothetical protein